MKYNKLFKFYNSNIKNKIRLFIFPFAGGGASAYKHWESFLSPEVEICCLQLPGREDRFLEEPYYHLDEFIQGFSEGFDNLLELPFVFFGHSLGTLLCYEFSHYLESKNAPLPLHVFLSGANPPSKNIFNDYARQLNNEELANELKKFNGIPNEILEDSVLLKIFLKIFRADISMIISYHYNNTYQFSMPITIFGGEADPAVDCKKLQDWNKLANDYCRIFTLPGGHFFIFSEKERLLSEINRELKYLTIS